MGYNHYYCRQHARFTGLNGPVEIPYGASLTGDGGGLILYEGKNLCYVSSPMATNFVQDDDHNGEKRAKLVNLIEDSLHQNDGKDRIRWYSICDDPIACKYVIAKYAGFWESWSRRFYDAPIDALEYIAELVRKG